MSDVDLTPPTSPSPSSGLSSRSSSVSSIHTPPNLHQNSIDPAAKWLVQKYGGTSVGKFAKKIAEDIIPNYLDQHKVAIVCSARSGSTKALGTTNLLLQAASEALRASRSSSKSVSATPGNATPNGPNLFSPSGSPRPRSKSSPRSDSGIMSMTASSSSASADKPNFNATVDVLRHVIIDEISPRSKDSIVGYGERLSCKIMAAILRDRGIDAEYVSLENIVPVTEELDSTDAETLGQEFYDRVAVAVGERIRQCGSRVPVVTGFFGPVPGSLLRQIGRGYTDLLSALLAVGLSASELQIWKEVDGIFTADPRKVPTARLIPIISPEEAAELTYYGSEVVHPFTMEQVIRRKIPIRIKNVENPQGGGTVIHPDPDVDSAPLEVAEDDEPEPPKLPTAVTIKENIVVLNVSSNRKSVSHGFLAGIFGVLDRFGVVVDLISTSEVHVSMAIEEGVQRKILDKVVRELRKSGTVSTHNNMAILSLVGKQMRHLVGIAGRMFTTLGNGNVNIEMISQGANEINISCVIDGRDAVKALNLIHQSCLQIRPHNVKAGPWLF
ncbi:Aspartokinase [Steccherinum ochraceum]|uniref:Aspartokinase n=1 Tax=Steccherinum ochraceum TaxID=92696 RepID=A0A4R0RJ05_9APHY|nr:Aspartokinase [Steccherinum ochraceum]